MRLLKAAVRRILLVSAETTTSWLNWSTPFFESATALIKTVSEPGLTYRPKSLGGIDQARLMALLRQSYSMNPS